jgi:hypothetical protein
MKKYLTQISILIPYTPTHDKKIIEKFENALKVLKKIPVSVLAENPNKARVKASEEYSELLYTIPGVDKGDKISALTVELMSSEEIISV